MLPLVIRFQSGCMPIFIRVEIMMFIHMILLNAAVCQGAFMGPEQRNGRSSCAIRKEAGRTASLYVKIFLNCRIIILIIHTIITSAEAILWFAEDIYYATVSDKSLEPTYQY